MAKRPFVRFYHQDWASDGDVNRMNMTEVGTYWTLLVRQMVDRFVPSDYSELRRPLNVFSVEEVENLITDHVKRKFHTAKCVDRECSGWNCTVEGDDTGKLYNKRLAEVIVETDAASNKGTENADRRYGRIRTDSLESSVSDREEKGSKLQFNFDELLRIMPKRKKKGVPEGWNSGLKQLQYVTSQEEYDTLMAATRAYAKTRKGEDAAFHYSLYNWVTKEFRGFIPEGFVADPSLPPTPTSNVEPGASQEATARGYPTSFMAPPNPVRSLPTGQRPPWVVDSYDWEAVAKAKKLFPDDDSKINWWLTPDTNEQKQQQETDTSCPTT